MQAKLLAWAAGFLGSDPSPDGSKLEPINTLSFLQSHLPSCQGLTTPRGVLT